MLKINGNQDKELTFEVEIGGVAIDSISARFRLVLDEIEYGFPAKVKEQSITVEMPALRKILHRKIKEGESVSARLDLISDGNIVSPWSDNLEVSEFVVSEAKLVDEEARDKARYLREKTEEVTGKDDEDSTDLESKIRRKLSEKKGESIEGKYAALAGADADVEMSSKIIDKLNEKLFGGGNKLKRGKDAQTLAEKVDITVARKKAKSTFSPRRASNTKGITKEMIRNFTREDVFAYMTRAGTTNSRVQEVLYEQATIAAKSESPVKILKEVIKIIKSKRRSMK